MTQFTMKIKITIWPCVFTSRFILPWARPSNYHSPHHFLILHSLSLSLHNSLPISTVFRVSAWKPLLLPQRLLPNHQGFDPVAVASSGAVVAATVVASIKKNWAILFFWKIWHFLANFRWLWVSRRLSRAYF